MLYKHLLSVSIVNLFAHISQDDVFRVYRLRELIMHSSTDISLIRKSPVEHSSQGAICSGLIHYINEIMGDWYLLSLGGTHRSRRQWGRNWQAPTETTGGSRDRAGKCPQKPPVVSVRGDGSVKWGTCPTYQLPVDEILVADSFVWVQSSPGAVGGQSLTK